MRAGSAKTMSKEHPARVAYDKLKGDDEEGEDDSEKEQPSGQKLSGPKDFERELGSADDSKEEPKEKPVIKTNLDDKQVEYYKQEANQSFDEKIDPENMPKEAKAMARNLFAKMQLMGTGDDIELSESDIHNLQYLVISGNSRSGQMYWQGRTDKAGDRDWETSFSP